MFPAARLKFLHERKQELLVQSEVNRRVAQTFCTDVRERVAWIERAANVARRIGPLLGLAIPLWRVFKSKRGGTGSSRLQKLTLLLPLAGKLNRFVSGIFRERQENV